MPNIAETRAALQQLAANGEYEVDVVDDTTVQVHREYEGVGASEPGTVGKQKNRFTLEVRLDLDAGEFTLHQSEDVTASGRDVGTGDRFMSKSTEKFSGASSSASASFSFGSGGSSSDSFRSKEMEGDITRTLEAQGWMKHRGFWAKLFGR